MVDYRIVKHCRLCRKRFLVNKGESKLIYCPPCQERVTRERQAQANTEA